MNRTTAHLPLLALAADVARQLPARTGRPWTAAAEPCLRMDGYPVVRLSDGPRTLLLGGDPSTVLALARLGHRDSDIVPAGPAAARDLADLAVRHHLAAIEREACARHDGCEQERELLLLHAELIRRADQHRPTGTTVHCPALGRRIVWQRRDRSQITATTTGSDRVTLALTDLPLPLVERTLLLVMGRHRRAWHRMPAEVVPGAAARRLLSTFPRLQPVPALSGRSFRLIWTGGTAQRILLTVRVSSSARGTDASTADLWLSSGSDLALRVLDEVR